MTLRNTIQNFFIAIVYFALAISSLTLSYHSSNASPVWPASGFAFAMLLLWKPRIAPGIFLGAFSANLYFFIDQQSCSTFTAVWVSLLIAVGNTLEGLAGYFVMRRLIPAIKSGEIFNKVNTVIFFVSTSLLMCLCSCTIGTTTVFLGGLISASEFFTTWFTWWTGDVSGILILTPFMLTWFSDEWKKNFTFSFKAIAEAIIIATAIVITSATVFTDWIAPNFLFTRAFIITPFLIWASLRLHLLTTTVLIAASACIAILGTYQGIGPFVGINVNESLITAEAFVSVNSVMTLLLHAALTERREKELSLQAARNSLEALVMERTKELYEKNRELESRNSELAMFSYSASHDLQEPLRKIEFFSNKIHQHENFSVQGKEIFQKITAAAARMKRLIESLLSYSTIENNAELFEPTDLNQLLQDVKNDLAIKIQETNAIITSGHLPQLNVIPVQFQQLFTNIINNAIKFCKPDTVPHITIAVGKIPGNNIAHTSIDKNATYYHFSFTDNGIGFEAEYQDKIFEILQRLHGKHEYEGTGIGLAICKRVVENHKGLITAESKPGKGCTIHVYLPVDELSDRISRDNGKIIGAEYSETN